MVRSMKSPSPRKKRSTSRRSRASEQARHRGQGGFSLAEVSVALGITALLFLAALSMLSLDHRLYNRDDSVLEAAREGRYAADKLERDLLMLGYQVDVRTIADPGPDGTENTDDDLTGQPQIAYAAPYEIVFNSDIDPTIDAIHDGLADDSTPTGYSPVTFHTGAETIRYTLDSSGDGTIDATDHGDDADEAVIKNDGLYLLHRETYGYNGTDNANPNGPIALVRGPTPYPNGSQAIPLFLYWGQFDSDPAEDLWGDDGTGGGTAGNGILEPGELSALGPVTDEDANDDAVLDAGEDRNGNGTLERRITQLITRVEVHVTTETSYPDVDYADPNRSDPSTPFRYRSVTTNTEIKPRNIELPGGACGDEPEPTSSPSVTNACASTLADGKVQVSWALSDDDGNFENDIEKYLLWRTDVNNIFGPTPFDEVIDGTNNWQDDWIEMRTWPPRQYWYRVRAMDCTPQLSRLDPVAGPYPPTPGAAYPPTFTISDVAGDDGTNLQVDWERSPDDPSNTTGYGGDVKKYYVYRSTSPDYRCVAPVNNAPVVASGAPDYTFTDNATNSSSGVVYGQLYYYWMRAMDDNTVLSPYSPRVCARSYQGPVMPAATEARVVTYGASDHPVEAWCLPNEDNDAAGYDPYLIEYKLYHSSDVNSDGTYDSMVDNAVGYTEPSNYEATKYWDGIFWAVGHGGSADIVHGITAGSAPRKLNNPTTETLRSIDFTDRLNGVAVGGNGTILVSHDGGASWSGSPGAFTAVDLWDTTYINDQAGITVGNSGTILRSDDGGDNWNGVVSPVVANLNSVSSNGNFVVAGGANGTVLTSTDGGQTFAENLTYPASDNIYAVCATMTSGGNNLVYVGSTDAVFISPDGGGTWAQHDFAGAGRVLGIACLESGHAMIATYSGEVWSTSNEGTTWGQEPISPATPRDVSMISPRLAWVAGSDGTIFYRDHTGNWQSLSIDSSFIIEGLVGRPEIVFEAANTADDASGTPYFGVLTTAYNQGSALDGEAGMTPDQSSAIENPDDSDPQILVDSCNNFELFATQP